MNKPIRTIAIFCLLLFVALMINATWLQYWKADDYDNNGLNRRVIEAAYSRERGAILVGREGAEEIPAVAQLRRRLQGVLVARQYVMLDYDCPDAILAQATAITPGIEGPTVSPLQRAGWSAVRAMVRRSRSASRQRAIRP